MHITLRRRQGLTIGAASLSVSVALFITQGLMRYPLLPAEMDLSYAVLLGDTLRYASTLTGTFAAAIIAVALLVRPTE